MAELVPRVATALVGIPLVILIVGWGRPWHFSLLVFLTTAGSLLEYFSLVFPDRWRSRISGTLLGLVLSWPILAPELRPELWLLAAFALGLFAHLFFSGESYRNLGWALLGALYAGFLVSHFALLYRAERGKGWVFFVLLVIMIGDTAAYFVGRLFGSRRLAPRISPGKTLEGALASLAASLLAGLIGGRFLLPGMLWFEALSLALILSILGQAGDLFESKIKRVFAVKDSSRLFPGHGGLLDRLDSLIFPVVFTAYYVRLVRS